MKSTDWLELIGDISEAPQPHLLNYSDNVASQFPFGQVWEGLSAKFFNNITSQVNCRHLSDAAIACLKRDLALRLSHICSVPVWEYYQRVILYKFPYLSISVSGGSDAYDWFSNFLLKGGLREFYIEYQVVADRSLSLLSLWSNSVIKFLNDLAIDIDLLQRKFFIRDDAMVDGLVLGLSDTHNGGQTVIAVEMSDGDGSSFLYKPKNLGTEVLFRDILNTLDRIPWKFNYIRTLDCGDHGWVEHINHQSATSEKCIEHYYKRAGVILCLAYILKLTDLHAENIIAQGDTPHVIDMEAMFHPFFLREKKTFTVLDTGLLPPESLDHVDIFGLTAIGGEPSQILHCRWRDIGKNEVQPEFVAGKFEVLGNMPILDGQRASAHRYVDCICEGFSLAYEELGNNTLKIKNIIINALCDDAFEVRVIPRSTMQYSIILRNLDIYHYRDIKSSISHIEEALQEGLYYSELDDLSIRRAEIEALERLDIPCFRLRIQKGDIIEHATLVKCIGNQVDAILAGTILNLSEADKGMQRQLIRESFFAPVIERPKI